MNTLTSINSSFDRFVKLPIEQSGHIYDKSLVDKVHSQLVADHLQLQDNGADDFCLIAPQDPSMLLTLTIQSLLETLNYDISSGSKHTLKDIKPGDTVGLIQDRYMYPSVFKGTEELYGKQYYVVNRADSSGLTEKIPPGREWRIQPYSSANEVASKRRGTVYGKLLEKILELPTGGLKAFQQSKILVVPDDKHGFIEQIRATSLGGDLLESIFPVAEYSTAADWHYIGHFGANNLKQQPSLGIVANADVAVDIALNDPDVRLLVISGAGKLRRNYGSIERLNYDETPRKILCLLSPTDEEEVLTLETLGIESWIWKRDDFQDTKPIADSSDDSPFAYHEELFDLLAGSSAKIVEVDLPQEIETTINNTYRTLYSLGRNANPLPESGLLVRWGLSLVNAMLQLPMTIQKHDDFVRANLGEDKTIATRLELFKTRLKSSYGLLIPSVFIKDADALINQLDAISNYFSAESPKETAFAALLEEKLLSTNTLGVFTSTPSVAAYLSRNQTRPFVASNAERIDTFPCDEAILTGWSNRKNVARSFLAPVNQLTWLLYAREANNVKAVYANHPASPHSKKDSNLRLRMGFAMEEQPVSAEETQHDQPVLSVEDLLASFTERFGKPDKLLQGISGENVQIGETVNARRINLSDDSFVYVDGDYKLDKIDRASNKLSRCKINQLQEGDELVFAETDRSMFEELLSILQESDEYKELLEKASVWRNALIDYVDRTNTSEAELVAMFKLIQYPKEIQTIRTWLRGQVIGPSGDNYAAIPAIERITHDERLAGNTDETIRACKAVHALHVQTGYLLVRSIVNSSVAHDHDINDETRERLAKYSASTRLRTIIEISDYTIPTSIRQIGKLEVEEL
jgi:hypothetical protein